MAGSDGAPGSTRGNMRLLRLALAGTSAWLCFMLLPDLLRATPLYVRLVICHPMTWLLLAVLPACLGVERFAGLAAARWARLAAARAAVRLGRLGAGRAAAAWAGRLADFDRWADPAAARLLGAPVAAALGAACAAMLLTWAPHYLTWPLWIDSEQFAISARSWAAGILPYRDLDDFDFPGPIYLFWALGKVFGWGRTTPFYAADVALLLLLGGALLAWSRRLFGTAIPGLIALLSWLSYYLGEDFSHAAQRDWQATALSMLGLLALEALPTRAGRPLSALGLAAAMAYRPQPVLFGPAFLSAVEESARRPGEPSARPLRALAWWSSAMAVALALAFAPLMAAGVLDDFVDALRITRYGGSYNPTTWYMVYLRSKDLFWDGALTPATMAALIGLAAAGPDGLRRPARTWLLAMIGALLYRPISPVQHDYLLQPMRLVQSVALALPVAWLVRSPRLTASTRLAGLIVLVAAAVPGWPRFCAPRDSLEALGPLARGELPERAPPGCRGQFRRVGWIDYLDPFPRAVSYDYWEDYRRTLLYLRDEVDRGRPVASLLRSLPIPVVNSPTGHLSPFPAAGGCHHLLQVNPALEGRFIEALERTPGTIVVWTPFDPLLPKSLRFPRLEAAVRRHYRPCARFGHIQVWVRSDEGDAPRHSPRD